MPSPFNPEQSPNKAVLKIIFSDSLPQISETDSVQINFYIKVAARPIMYEKYFLRKIIS